jgi:hypothetical protein
MNPANKLMTSDGNSCLPKAKPTSYAQNMSPTKPEGNFPATRLREVHGKFTSESGRFCRRFYRLFSVNAKHHPSHSLPQHPSPRIQNRCFPEVEIEDGPSPRETADHPLAASKYHLGKFFLVGLLDVWNVLLLVSLKFTCVVFFVEDFHN